MEPSIERRVPNTAGMSERKEEISWTREESNGGGGSRSKTKTKLNKEKSGIEGRPHKY